MRRRFSKWMSDNALSVPPCRTLLDIPPLLGPVTTDIEAYHQARRSERARLMAALSADFPMQYLTFCSVGAGAAGEESLIDCGRLVLIEPDPRFADYLRRKYPHAQVISHPYESVAAPSDVIYAASLGPWMNADPALGVDAQFLAFCRRNLRPRGAIVALIYGGLHTAFVLDRRYYLEQLMRCGFHVALYGKYKETNALLVLTQEPRVFPGLAREVDVLIEGGKIIRQGAPAGLAAGVALIAIHALRNLTKIAAEAIYLLRTHVRLRR